MFVAKISVIFGFILKNIYVLFLETMCYIYICIYIFDYIRLIINRLPLRKATGITEYFLLL